MVISGTPFHVEVVIDEAMTLVNSLFTIILTILVILDVVVPSGYASEIASDIPSKTESFRSMIASALIFAFTYVQHSLFVFVPLLPTFLGPRNVPLYSWNWNFQEFSHDQEVNWNFDFDFDFDQEFSQNHTEVR